MGRRASGTVYEKPAGSGQWWFAFVLRDGSRHAARVPPHPDGGPLTRARAEQFKAEAMRRYQLGTWDPKAPLPAPAPPMPTVHERATAWAKDLPHGSAYNERGIVKNHLGPDSMLGPLPVDRVEAHHLVAWVRQLRATPVKRGGTLAPGTVHAIYNTLKKMLAEARFAKLIPSNPCDELPPGTLPVLEDKDPTAREGWPYTRAEAQRLVSAPEIPLPRRVLYAILFLTGVRISEAVVLRWGYFEPEREPLGGILVARSWNQKLRTEKSTKTGTTRRVPVHPTLAAVLAEWKLGGFARCFRRAPEPGDYLVPTRTMKRRNARNVHAQLKADCEKLGIRPRRVHGTRHSFMSFGIDDGGRWDILQQLTHPKPQRGRQGRSSAWVYRHEAWETYCTEVAKIRFTRLADVLPLWKVAAGGDPGQSDTATNSATGRGDGSPRSAFQATFSPSPASARSSGSPPRGTRAAAGGPPARPTRRSPGAPCSPSRRSPPASRRTSRA